MPFIFWGQATNNRGTGSSKEGRMGGFLTALRRRGCWGVGEFFWCTVILRTDCLHKCTTLQSRSSWSAFLLILVTLVSYIETFHRGPLPPNFPSDGRRTSSSTVETFNFCSKLYAFSRSMRRWIGGSNLERLQRRPIFDHYSEKTLGVFIYLESNVALCVENLH